MDVLQYGLHSCADIIDYVLTGFVFQGIRQ